MHVFISDAHIRSDKNYRSRVLRKFLRDITSKMTHLYILGDLFEFWFEYAIVFPKDYFKTLAVLYNLIEHGKKIHYILGNHEVMIGNFLRNFGFIVHGDETVLNIDGKRIFLAHGNKIDRRFWTTLWEKLLTSKLNHALYSIIHPDIGVFLAQGIAYLSRKQRRSPRLAQSLEHYARRKLREATHIFQFLRNFKMVSITSIRVTGLTIFHMPRLKRVKYHYIIINHSISNIKS